MTAIDEAIKFVVDALTEGKSPEEIKLLQDDMNRLHAGIQKGIYDQEMLWGGVGLLASAIATSVALGAAAAPAYMISGSVMTITGSELKIATQLAFEPAASLVTNTTTDGVSTGDYIPFNPLDHERLTPINIAIAAATNEEDRAFYMRLLGYEKELAVHAADLAGQKINSLWENVQGMFHDSQAVMTDIPDGQGHSPNDVADNSTVVQSLITRK